MVTVREVFFSSVSVVPSGSVVVSSLTLIFWPTSSSGVPGRATEYLPSASEVPLADYLAVDLDADLDVGDGLGWIGAGVDEGAHHVDDVVAGLGFRRRRGAEHRDEDQQWK